MENKYEEYLNKLFVDKITKNKKTHFKCPEEIFLFNGVTRNFDYFEITTTNKVTYNDYNEKELEYTIEIKKIGLLKDFNLFNLCRGVVLGFLYFFMSCVNRYIKYQITYKYPSSFIYFIFLDYLTINDDIQKIILPENILNRERVILFFFIIIEDKFYYFTYLKSNIFDIILISRVNHNKLMDQKHKLYEIYTYIKNIKNMFKIDNFIYTDHDKHMNTINIFLRDKLLPLDPEEFTKQIRKKNFLYCFYELMNYDLKPQMKYFSDSFIIQNLNINSIVKYIKKIKY